MDEIYLKTSELNSWIAKHFDKDLISVEELIGVIEDLDSELEDLQYKYDELERDLHDNYKPIPKNEQYEVYNDDFI